MKVVDSEIKGYHAFKIKPHCAIKMNVLPENDNNFYACAIVIKMPDLKDITRVNYMTRLLQMAKGNWSRKLLVKLLEECLQISQRHSGS